MIQDPKDENLIQETMATLNKVNKKNLFKKAGFLKKSESSKKDWEMMF